MHAVELGLWPLSLSLLYLQLDYTASHLLFALTRFLLCLFSLAVKQSVPSSFLFGAVTPLMTVSPEVSGIGFVEVGGSPWSSYTFLVVEDGPGL